MTQPSETELDALSWNPTVEEADAYLRGHGVIKKCEHCGQDATLTNNFVTHLLERFSQRMKEADAAATQMRTACVEKVKEIAARYKREQFAEAGNQRIVEKTRWIPLTQSLSSCHP